MSPTAARPEKAFMVDAAPVNDGPFGEVVDGPTGVLVGAEPGELVVGGIGFVPFPGEPAPPVGESPPVPGLPVPAGTEGLT